MQLQLSLLLLLLRGASSVTIDAPRFPIDSTSAVVTVTLGPGDVPWPATPFSITIARRGRMIDNYGYATWAMQIPTKGDNFKKNNSFDFFVLEPEVAGTSRRITLPRVATPGNTTLCVSFNNGTCMPGFNPGAFEHFVAATVEFGRRPYLEEDEGCILATADLSFGKSPVALVANIGSLTITGRLTSGRTSRIVFPLESLPASLDMDVNITVGTGDLAVTHTRRFIRKPPPPEGSAATSWQVDHERGGLRVDGKRFFGTGWFGAGSDHISAGLPPSAYIPYLGEGATLPLAALAQASMLAEWGKAGINLVRIGGPYDFAGGNWSVESERVALANFRIVLDAAHAAGIYLICGMPVQAWGNAISGINVTKAPWTTEEDWRRWTLGNMSLAQGGSTAAVQAVAPISKFDTCFDLMLPHAATHLPLAATCCHYLPDHPAIAGWYGCDDCCHPGVEEKMGPVQVS
jgi:hypothetical protein